jgi:hypothetical protein
MVTLQLAVLGKKKLDDNKKGVNSKKRVDSDGMTMKVLRFIRVFKKVNCHLLGKEEIARP